MKKYELLIVVFLISSLNLVNAQNIINGQIIRKVKGLNIIIDKRMEMLSVVQYLAESKLVADKKISYADSVKKYFEPFKKQKVVSLYKAMEQQGFNADAPVYLMLFLNSKFEIIRKFDKYLISRAKDENKLNEFIKELQEFNALTNFDKFFSNNYKLLKQSVDMLVDRDLRNFDEINTIENFYGYKQNSYNVILVALSIAGYGPNIDAGNGKLDVYNIVGFNHSINGIPAYGDEQTFKYMVWHEFSHSFVNPLVDNYYSEFEKYKRLEKPILSIMGNLGYGNWNTILCEHIVRAITTSFSLSKYGKEKADLALKEEKDQGFIYLDRLYSKLLEYSTNRNGRDFKQFFPEFIGVMKSYFEKPIDFKYIQTPVEFFSDNKDFALVYSTNEKNEILNKKIKNYVDTLNKKYYEIPVDLVIPDTLALKLNLKDYAIFCYGSIDGNLWLKSKIKDLPLQIYQDKVIASKAYNQSNLKIISTWKNPDNPEKFIIIYTAQNSEQILDFNIFHGPNNYVIANDKLEVIEKGDYRYKDGKFYIKNN